LRKQLGLPSRYFLASKRFIPKKNLRRVIEAFALFRTKAGADGWHLVILGDGPLEPEVRHWCQELGVTESVHLQGFRQYDETPTYYGLAGAFIHASTTEQWGLVVNEAMAAGLPVLVSKRCGCATDLVKSGVNGFCFDPENVSEIAGLMWTLAFQTDLSAFGAASRRIISSWSTDTFGRSLLSAHDVSTPRSRAQLSLADSMMLRLLTSHPPQNADSMAYVRHRRNILAR
jgi:glycosyltransferase involved in cell wall biosynthesis